MHPSKFVSSAILAGALIAHASPKPMEPASRTLFVFVHGINPKCSGAIDNANDADAHPQQACHRIPPFDDEVADRGTFCVDRANLLGRSGQSWVKGLDGERSDDALFCVLHRELFDGNYSLRSFSDPGESPVTLAHELGDRDWSTPQNTNLRSHAIEAMRRYAETRRDRAKAKLDASERTTSFENALLGYGTAPITDLRPIFSSFADSMPNRMVVLAHSMGGLTTREYLVSDYYGDDLDKVVTFDSPHKGSWVAKYNQDGIRTGWNVPTIRSAMKLAYGGAFFAGMNPVSDGIAGLLTISASAGLTAGLFQTYGGAIGNDFKGDEAGSRYLTPGSLELEQLNSTTSLACEAEGCRPPRFVIYSTDGSLAPDDPKKLISNHPFQIILPTELLGVVQAGLLAGMRDWPDELSPQARAFNSFVATMFAEGGWNYSQHGSLPVANHSGNANDIAFFSHPELETVRHAPLVFDPQWVSAAEATFAARQLELGAILMGCDLAYSGINATSVLLGAPSLSQPAKFFLALGVGAGLGKAATAEFGLYAKSYAPSHNLAVSESAKRKNHASYVDALGKTVELDPRWIEDDLYEAPFVQLRADREDGKKDGQFVLRMGSGAVTWPPVLWKVSEDALAPIEYARPGWEQRWGIREERQRPVGMGGTTVRDVRRWSLPFELLTTDDVRRMEFQVDDLRPDRLEQLSLTVNWGALQLVWDRERDAAGNDLGTYRISRFASGTLKETRDGQPDPVDAYGRWTVEFDRFLPAQILRDGRNLVAVSLVNHVGKRSDQFQYLIRQATPPLVDVHFPHPWESVSGTDGHLSARVSLLHYDGLSIDPIRSGWMLEKGPVLFQFHEESDFAPFENLDPGASEVELDRPIGDLDDGVWTNLFRTVSTTSNGQTSLSERSVPFVLDRTAPVLRCTGSSSPTRPGTERELVLSWSDGDPAKGDILELVRPRILDAQGRLVVELPPRSFIAGRELVLKWNGKVGDTPVPDGSYSVVVDARDAAVPNAETRSRILALRKDLSIHLASWSGTWEPGLDAEWNSLRARSDLNWSSSRFEFRIDATAPEANFDALPTKPLSREERLHVRFKLRDPGTPGPNGSLHVHLECTPIEGTLETVHSLDATLESVGATFPDEFDRDVGEFESEGRFLLPDGVWRLSGFVEDEAGNRTSWSDLGRISIDRTPPRIASLRASSIVLPSGVASSGQAVLDAQGAVAAEAVWVSPDGSHLPATPNAANGSWNFEFPSNMGETKGVWHLDVTAKDEAGNSVSGVTQVWVGLLPPKLVLAGTRDDEIPTVTGPIALEGIAMDPEVDDHEFVSYALQWRWVGESDWRTDGMSVPAGRGSMDSPWKSPREQNHLGLLGFWTPPVGSGAIELRVLVDDGTGALPGHEAIREVYRGADVPLDFSVTAHLDPNLGSAISSRMGLDILGETSTPSSYRAQATFVDSRGELLLAKDLVDLQASRFEGMPLESSPGRFQIWHDDTWHLRANAVCRATTFHLLSSDETAFPESCPDGWTCSQRVIDPLVMPKDLGGATYRRALDITIPPAARGEWTFPLAGMVRIDLESDPRSESCPDLSGICGETATGSTSPLPLFGASLGQLTTGKGDLPWCNALRSIELEPGMSSWSTEWNGLRPDGTIPAEGPAKLEVVAWNPATGRVATGSVSTDIRLGEGRIHAWAENEVSISAEAPSLQKSAGLAFTLEGRGADLQLQILSGDRLVKTLAGSDRWYEGRSGSRPYSTLWDGTDTEGSLVPAGEYVFRVREIDGPLVCDAKVSVTGSSWREDPSLRLSLPESRWDPEANAWRLSPKPELRISTKATASLVQEGEFTYAADWSGKQLVTVFPASRFSLMVQRHRETVKFGILFRMVLNQKVYGDDGACDGARDGAHELAEAFSGVHIVELHPGEVARVDVQGFARPSGGGYIYRFEGGPHTVEYRIVPLSEIDRLSSISDIEQRWYGSKDSKVTSGSFQINDLQITPTFGEFDTRPTVGPFDWNTPSDPELCAPELLSAFSDPSAKGVESGTNPCGLSNNESLESHNPHRNLIQFRALPWIDEMRTAMVPTEKVVTNRTGTYTVTENVPTSVHVLEYAHGTAHADCAGNAKRNEFGFHFELSVPDAYWNPPVGVENLANRFLRFDSRNKFLFGANGYLLHDDFDNDGIGPADDDDPGEQEGSVAAFETKRFRWRPRLTDILDAKECETNNASIRYCHEAGRQWASDNGTRFGDWQFERPDEDPLYFSEGDHGRSPDLLRAWFENTPEQGAARWQASITQGENSVRFNSAEAGPAHAITFAANRGAGLGDSAFLYDGTTIWSAEPVDISVELDGSIEDFRKNHWQTPMSWPLDAPTFEREKQRIEADCAGTFAGLCRVYAAASGVRFGVDDGLEPSTPSYGSSAQQAVFDRLAAGEKPEPDLIPGGLPDGNGSVVLKGLLHADAGGALRFADPTHFSAPSVGVPLLDAKVVPRVVEWNGIPLQARLDPGPTAVFWSEPSAPDSWTLTLDPRVAPRDRLEAPVLWNSALSRSRWSLLDLYRLATDDASSAASDPSLSLYRKAGGWSLNPSLRSLRLVEPKVKFRNGSEASDAFDIASDSRGPDDPGLLVNRQASAWSLPEWIPLLGSVASGETFQMGWIGRDEIWHPSSPARSSECSESETRSATCLLGYLDAKTLPAEARIAILVGSPPDRRFVSLPIAQGTVIDPDHGGEVRSLFGEVAVNFPAGALAGKSIRDRSIVVRAWNPAQAGILIPDGLAVSGPVVEILPSQTFSSDLARQPQIKLRLSRDDLDDLEGAAGLGLFKISEDGSSVTPLGDRSVTFLCEREACDASNAQFVEFTGTTSTFSHFAILPLATPESVDWSLHVTPTASASVLRNLRLEGRKVDEMIWHLDDDPNLDDAVDETPPTALHPTLASTGEWTIECPAGRHWIFATSREGGASRSVELVRFSPTFQATLSGLEPIVLGTVNGSASRVLNSDREGEWTLILEGTRGIEGFLEGRLSSPETLLEFPSDLLGPRWAGAIGSRLSLRSIDGQWLDLDGPAIIADANLPELRVSSRIEHLEDGSVLHLEATGSDEEGVLRELTLSLRTLEGRPLLERSTQDGRIDVDLPLSGLPDGSALLRLVASAIDRGGNHVELDTILELPDARKHGPIWIEAETLVPSSSTLPVCALESRRAARFDSTEWIVWALPRVSGNVRLAGRWRSASAGRIEIKTNHGVSGEWTLEARPTWGHIEVTGPSFWILGGDSVRIRVPQGTQWDGFALVADSSSLEGWKPPATFGKPRAEVWIRDEAPNDPNMVHARVMVRNVGTSKLDAYRLRISVHPESPRQPVAESWWPGTLASRWESTHEGNWTLILDRDSADLAPGADDFQGVGAALGLHDQNWTPWNREDDPAWPNGLPAYGMTLTKTIPVFDRAESLISDWECGEDPAWPSEGNSPIEPSVELRGTSPTILDRGATKVVVLPEGAWNWQQTVIGLTPLDGQVMEGFIHFGERSWPLHDSWQELRIPNPSRQSLELRIAIPPGRRFQIQKWEE